ncbi:MAG: dockerin type I repeat-containing protein [Ruminococcus sp.]|uniref:dockerin type I repeat-containing protein n=1 Tax=Ruminococcus sp. TaxID=41978 RepID=UPI0025F8511F|nr:dockerin type I repeat-containing protein [Ruminococcus sp.]MCR5541209.1 dockerin type I repeat-containing protein [Ruminococcus sp.]
MKKIITSMLAVSMITGMACMSAGAEAEYNNANSNVMVANENHISATNPVVDLLKSATNGKDSPYNHYTVYDGSDAKSFKVKGRTYYYGITQNGNISSFSLNTQKVKKLSFKVAHLDNSSLVDDSTLTIYLDGEKYKTYTLTYNMIYLPIDIDTTEFSKVRFDFGEYKDSRFALVDFKVDGKTAPKGADIPKYTSVDSLINSAYDTNTFWLSETTIYDSSKKLGFKMKGRTYYNGILMRSGGGFSLNTENVDSISFDLSHVDNSGIGDSAVKIYLDNELYENKAISIAPNTPIKRYTLDLKNIDNIRIETNRYTETSYAVGNIEFNNIKSQKSYKVPTYDDAIDFINSKFNDSGVTVYDNTQKLGFNMDGVNYKQGLQMSAGGAVSFNTESIKKLSFKLGYIDNSVPYSGNKLQVYLDGELKEISIEKNQKTQNVDLDVSNVKCVKINFSDKYANTKYGLANISIVNDESKITIKKGDVNFDKKINVTDITKVAAHIKGKKLLTGDSFKAADVNNDNIINVTDITKIAAHIKGRIVLD